MVGLLFCSFPTSQPSCLPAPCLRHPPFPARQMPSPVPEVLNMAPPTHPLEPWMQDAWKLTPMS